MRKIIAGKRLVPAFTYEEKKLPTHLPVAQYIRQSSEGQLKHNKQSSKIQDQKLRERLTIMGFTEIIKIETDTGSSGQVIKGGKLLERKGLEQLHQLITSGTIGAVAAFSPSRLYRDLTREFYARFVHMLETYQIPLIVYADKSVKIYWPDSRVDMDALMSDFAAAARFIEEEVQGKLVLAKNQAVEDNVSYGGGSVPFGYVVKTTEDRKFFVVYLPHAEKIRYIYKRYKELNFNLPRLGRELQAQGFAFPEFDMEQLRKLGVERKPYVTLRYRNGGYPCYTREALLSILTNPAYIGWYCYAGAIISGEAHEAIVDRADFEEAFQTLSPINLDGSENTNKPKIKRRYGQYRGLVEEILTCNGNPCYAMKYGYEVREKHGNWNWTSLTVPVSLIDMAISGAILGVLAVLEYRHVQGVVDDLYQQIETLAQEKKAEGVSLIEALKTIDNAIKGWELDKQSCRETGNKQGLDEANRQLRNLYAAKEQVLEQAKHAAKEVEDLEETKSLHQQVIDNWFTMPFERQQRYVRLIIAGVTMEEVAPRILKLAVTFKPPIMGSLTGYVMRTNAGQHAWTGEEETALRSYYTYADRAEILQAIPKRSWQCIRQQALEMGISRATWANTSGIPGHLSYNDWTRLAEIQKTCPDFGIRDVLCLQFKGIVLNVNNKQGLPHHLPGEHSPPGMLD